MATIDELHASESARVARRPALTGRVLRVLAVARREWEKDSARLAEVRGLSDEQRTALRAVVREWDARGAAAWSSRTRHLDWLFFTVAGGLVLFVPAAVMFIPAAAAFTTAGMLTALATYLGIFGMLVLGYFLRFTLFRLIPRREAHPLRIVQGAGAAIGLLFGLGALLIVMMGHAGWLAIRFGLLAGLISAVMFVLAHWTLGVLFSYVWVPWRRRSVGVMPPSRVVAACLWFLIDKFDRADSTWRHPSTRRDLLGWISYTTTMLGRRAPRWMWFAGYRGQAHEDAVRRYMRAAGFTRGLAWRVVDARGHADLDSIRQDLVDASVAAAAGDWDHFPEAERPTSTARAAAVARRLLSFVTLAAAALALPQLPGISLTEPAVTTLQVALLIAAGLSLAPREGTTHERVLGGFGDAHSSG